MARILLELNEDEIRRDLAYALICETRETSVWNTMRRKRAWLETFSEKEREKCTKIFNQAHSWYLIKGVPDSIVMSTSTYALWKKLEWFCASL